MHEHLCLDGSVGDMRVKREENNRHQRASFLRKKQTNPKAVFKKKEGVSWWPRGLRIWLNCVTAVVQVIFVMQGRSLVQELLHALGPAKKKENRFYYLICL